MFQIDWPHSHFAHLLPCHQSIWNIPLHSITKGGPLYRGPGIAKWTEVRTWATVLKWDRCTIFFFTMWSWYYWLHAWLYGTIMFLSSNVHWNVLSDFVHYVRICVLFWICFFGTDLSLILEMGMCDGGCCKYTNFTRYFLAFPKSKPKKKLR